MEAIAVRKCWTESGVGWDKVLGSMADFERAHSWRVIRAHL